MTKQHGQPHCSLVHKPIGDGMPHTLPARVFLMPNILLMPATKSVSLNNLV